MKRTIFLFACLCTWTIASAIELKGTHILAYTFNRVIRNSAVTIDYETITEARKRAPGDVVNVTITNLFNYGTTVNAYYDETTNTLHIPAGQNVRSEENPVYLYSFTEDANGQRTYDKTGDIVFDVKENSRYTLYTAQRDMAATSDAGTSTMRNVQFRNNPNATLRCEVLDYQSQNVTKAIESYDVIATQVSEGVYRIDNFGQRARIYLYLQHYGSVTTKYGDYPIDYSTKYKNFYFPCAFEWRDNHWNSAADRTIYGTVNGNQITLSSVWNSIMDNKENMDVDEAYRHVYRYDNNMHRNTTITLNSGNFILPHATHLVKNDELLLTTKENFIKYNQEGWMWSGDTEDDANVVETTNKKTTIEPGTDNTISPTIYSGLNIKTTSSAAKNIYMRVRGVVGVKFYVTSNGNTERTAVVTAQPTEGNAVTKEVSSTTDGAVGRIDGLDANQTYTLHFSTTKEDMTLYAVQFFYGATGIDPVSAATGTEADKAIYDLQGRRVSSATVPGLYISNGRKVIVK